MADENTVSDLADLKDIAGDAPAADAPAAASSAGPDDVIWYVSYGSNMCAARLGAYLRGGRPDGSHRDHGH